jgi:hypothetical protein
MAFMFEKLEVSQKAVDLTGLGGTVVKATNDVCHCSVSSAFVLLLRASRFDCVTAPG